jgi:acetate kinase
MAVLVLNSGSSSLKFALVDPASGKRSFEGEAERLGTHDAAISIRTTAGDTTTKPHPLPVPSPGDHRRALSTVIEKLDEAGLKRDVDAVGHRVVHGGEAFTDAALVTDAVEAAIEDAARLAPLHNPANLLGIRAARAAFPHLPQVAVFDTAFHHSMPEAAFRYAVPEAWYREHGVRKYGFHGTSYRYVTARAAASLGKPLGDLELLVAHLGNGCSACAVRGGRSVDTTMGLTPLAGLVMGTRSGDLDPSVVAYVASRLGEGADGVTRALNQRAGLLGLSGLSNDMRGLLEARDRGHEGAALAVDVFCHRLAVQLLGLAAALTRVDAVVFTGGIGEHAAPIRAAAIAKLWPLGARIDERANAKHGAPTGLVSAAGTLAVYVIPTDEEQMIAEDTRRVAAPTATTGEPAGPR